MHVFRGGPTAVAAVLRHAVVQEVCAIAISTLEIPSYEMMAINVQFCPPPLLEVPTTCTSGTHMQ